MLFWSIQKCKCVVVILKPSSAPYKAPSNIKPTSSDTRDGRWYTGRRQVRLAHSDVSKWLKANPSRRASVLRRENGSEHKALERSVDLESGYFTSMEISNRRYRWNQPRRGGEIPSGRVGGRVGEVGRYIFRGSLLHPPKKRERCTETKYNISRGAREGNSVSRCVGRWSSDRFN